MIRVEYAGRSGKGLIAAVVGMLRRKRARPQIESLLAALPRDTDNFDEVLKVMRRYADVVVSGEAPVAAPPPRRRDGLEHTDLLF